MQQSQFDQTGSQQLTFGKYKGKTIQQVHITDPSYLHWLTDPKTCFKDQSLAARARKYIQAVDKPLNTAQQNLNERLNILEIRNRELQSRMREREEEAKKVIEEKDREIEELKKVVGFFKPYRNLIRELEERARKGKQEGDILELFDKLTLDEKTG